MKPVLVVSVGCPAGIGPEVSLRAGASFSEAHVVLVGDRRALLEEARVLGVHAIEIDRAEALGDLPSDAVGIYPGEPIGEAVRLGEPTAAAGRASLAWINQACDLTRQGFGDALVTGPVSKAAIALSSEGAGFLGHTEHLARRLGAPEVVMAFWSRELVTSLVTTHLALRDVPRAIDQASVAKAVYFTARLLADLGQRGPIAVASLNPHAGESGLLGDEESEHIVPGIAAARARLAADALSAIIEGPIGAETALRKAVEKHFDAVVCMYHDQATIAEKLTSFGEAVNVSLGLPIIRTSVDHGTGYDIAQARTANPRSMEAALRLAAKLCRSRFERGPRE